jgi:predicted lipoprotein with Yx(FWY)xxD motif
MNRRLHIHGGPIVRAVLVLAALLVAGAASPVLASVHSPAAAAAPVKTSAAHILVTTSGRTLYVFAPDSRNKSTCYGQCAKFWPPLLLKKGSAPASQVGNIAGNFGVATRKDGSKQLTFDGAPLYTFAEDKKAGDMNGQGVVAAGGYWWAVAAGT